MNQSQDLKIKCSDPEHNDLINFICFEESCKSIRLFCNQCQKDGIHENHSQNYFELPKLFDYVQQVGQECDNILVKLEQSLNIMNHSIQTLIKEIKKKYQIPIAELIKLNSQQIYETLDVLFRFKSYKTSITIQIEENLINFQQKVERISLDLKLNEKLISFYLSESDIQESQELFQKGYQLYQEFDMYEEAIKIFEQALSINPNNQLAIWCKAASLRMLGEYNKAIIWADKALALDPKHSLSLYCKAASLRMLNKYHEAIIWADKALAIDPEDCFALSCKGSSLRLIQRYYEANQVINNSLNINPNHFDSLKEKGACLQDQNQFKQAILFYQKALKQIPNDQWIKSRYDQCLQALKKIGK